MTASQPNKMEVMKPIPGIKHRMDAKVIQINPTPTLRSGNNVQSLKLLPSYNTCSNVSMAIQLR